MQPDRTIQRIATKEVTLFFASPVAYLFLISFAAVTLFIFFWGEAFFARNIADVRPLFEWMPLLLIFLASTLTMRMWSEERRSGTLEHVLTQPVALWRFVVGKFVACLLLLAIAMAITLPLPLTVSWLGDLDWGPVWSGYLATFLLGAAYLSVGLFVSARSENQIVSLISAVALCGGLYLVGAPAITDLMGNRGGELLRLLGTGARFESITRGVVDLRDLYYYVSLIGVFLSLNIFVLERDRWAMSGERGHHAAWRTMTALLIANALGANLWLGQVDVARIDTTEGGIYSISDATQGYLDQLQEPLLIRGYFSAKTHPLLAPLVPQMRDLLREYEVAGGGRIRTEFVDPVANPELEEEANQRYGIRAVPFQVADRYQAALVNSYFNLLIEYGDEHQTLGFRDLIEIKSRSETDLDVQLRNPEYDITQAIRKVIQGYQAGGNLFDTVKGDLQLNAYLSADGLLPTRLIEFKGQLLEVAETIRSSANGRLHFSLLEPEANGGAIAQQIERDYGFRPMATSLLSEQRFWFYLTLSQGEQVVQIPHGDLSREALQRNLEAGIKRFASGFTKTVALVTPQPDPEQAQYAQYLGQGPKFAELEAFLGEELTIQREDLSDGQVDGRADILLLAAPKELDERALFAVDQFLMQGGTVIAATSPFSANLGGRSLALQPHSSGMEQWLEHHGLTVDQQLVLDPQNAAFPVPVTRSVAGFRFQEIRMLDYPYFVDVRDAGLNPANPISAEVHQATMAWASPIRVAERPGRRTTSLLQSSDQAWLSSSTEVMPRVTSAGGGGFTPMGARGVQLLGVVSEGGFDSFFAGKTSPLLADERRSPKTGAEVESAPTQAEGSPFSGVIARSPESARIILFSSNAFLSDDVIKVNGAAGGSEYLNTLQLIANSIDWSLEDQGLLTIRARGHFNRTLPPMDHEVQLWWEYLNYLLSLLAIGAVALIERLHRRARQRHYLQLLAQ